MSGLVWLASYPKSGSTWLRTMLSALLSPEHEVNLHELIGRATLDTPSGLDEELGFDPAELSPDALNEVRAAAFRRAAASAPATTPTFQKTHLANITLRDGARLFDEQSGRAVYLVRDPRDVAVSYSHYIAEPVTKVVEAMCGHETVLGRAQLVRPTFLQQPMGSWSGHAQSWVDSPSLPVLTVRYEDLLADPAGQLGRVAAFAGLDASTDALMQAVQRTSLSALRALEDEHGFPERMATADRFFRNGVAGEGLSLPDELQHQLIASCGPTMQKLGYGSEVSTTPASERQP